MRLFLILAMLVYAHSSWADNCLKVIYRNFFPTKVSEGLLSYLKKGDLPNSNFKIIGEAKLSNRKMIYQDNLGGNYLVEWPSKNAAMDEVEFFNTVTNKWNRVVVSSENQILNYGSSRFSKPSLNVGSHYSSTANQLIQEMRKKTQALIESKSLDGINALLTNDVREALKTGVAFKDGDQFGILSLVKHQNQDVFIIKSPTKKANMVVTSENGNQFTLTQSSWDQKWKKINGVASQYPFEWAVETVNKIGNTKARKILIDKYKSDIIGGAAKLMFYPTVAPFSVFKAIDKALAQNNGFKNFYKIPFEYIKQDGGYLLGYATLIQTQLHPLMLFEKQATISFDEFTNKTDKKNSGITVYMDGIPNDNDLYGFGEYDFKSRVKLKSGQAIYYRPKDVADIKITLEKISREYGKISRLELLGHGISGLMQINNSSLNSDSIKNLKLTNVFNKNGEIKLISCLVGSNNTTNHTGENFMYDLGKAFLSEGGRVVAATKIISVNHHNFPEDKRKYDPTIMESYWKHFSYPFKMAILLGMELFANDKSDIRTVTIP